MDSYVWGSALHTIASYVKDRIRTPQDVEKEIEDLKKRIEAHFEYELNDQMMRCLNSSLLWHEASAQNLESDIKALESVSAKVQGTSDWIILHALFTSRLEHDKQIIAKHKQQLDECLQKSKDYAFEVRSKELREELKEMKELAETTSEEPKES